MAVSRQDRPQMFRRVIFDRVADVQAREVVHDDAPAPAPPPIERPRRTEPRPTLSILHRPPATPSRGSD